MKTEIKNDNELIAEFMGGLKRDGGYSNLPIPATNVIISETCFKYTHELKCYQTWDWLMPVVQKIFDTEFGEKFEDWRVLNGRIVNAIGRIDIIDAHKKVVEFIRWYNSQTTSNPEQS